MAIWQFETKNFRVEYDVAPEQDLDLSWDETGEVAEKLQNGVYEAFVACVRVVFKPTGCILSDQYLGGCIYKSPRDFIDHREAAAQTRALRVKGERAVVGSYFADMVRGAVSEARRSFALASSVRLRQVGGTE